MYPVKPRTGRHTSQEKHWGTPTCSPPSSESSRKLYPSPPVSTPIFHPTTSLFTADFGKPTSQDKLSHRSPEPGQERIERIVAGQHTVQELQRAHNHQERHEGVDQLGPLRRLVDVVRPDIADDLGGRLLRVGGGGPEVSCRGGVEGCGGSGAGGDAGGGGGAGLGGCCAGRGDVAVGVAFGRHLFAVNWGDVRRVRLGWGWREGGRRLSVGCNPGNLEFEVDCLVKQQGGSYEGHAARWTPVRRSGHKSFHGKVELWWSACGRSGHWSVLAKDRSGGDWPRDQLV